MLFRSEIGFLTRRGFLREFLQLRYSPRPKIKGLRRLWWDASIDNIHDPRVTDPRDSKIQTRKMTGDFKVLAMASKSGLLNSFHSVTMTKASAVSKARGAESTNVKPLWCPKSRCASLRATGS